MSQAQLLEQGEQAYANKNYNEAAQICTRILSSSKGLVQGLVKVLDMRCQAYSKLGNYDLAKHDAKRMIRIGRRIDPDGYLRCSQIDRLLGDYVSAIKWLEHGKQNVPKHRAIFEQQIDKIHVLQKRQNDDRKRQDPVASFPLEILQLIVSYLEYREIVILLPVSKTWKSVLDKLQPLITTVDFTGCQRTIPYQACSAAFRRLCKQPQTLIFPLLSTSAKNMVHSWLSKSINLEYLQTLHLQDAGVGLRMTSLKHLHRIKSLSIDPSRMVGEEKFIDTIATCHSLEDMSLCNVSTETLQAMSNFVQPRLQHLRLLGPSNSSFVLPAEFLNRYPNLQSLHLQYIAIRSTECNLSQHQHLRILHLELASGELVLDLPASLQDLSCIERIMGPMRGTMVVCNTSKLPNLTKVALGGAWAHETIRVMGQSIELPRLDHVNLYKVQDAMFERMPVESYSMLKKCRKLGFRSIDLRNKHSDVFAKIFPNIESLVLEAPRVTGVFLSDLLSKPDCQLREIKLIDCNSMSSDTRSWLEARDIVCQVARSSFEPSGAWRIVEI